ncbi:MAG: FtsW/RodA/SpoVE family cell cycle protein [Actinobacteria bacterium]|nr:FtsW/RodA/SpoVE family cell cycle protein [Actinomycetota bacterium]
MIERVRRNAELSMVVLGALVVAAAYVLASLGATASIPANIGPFLVVVLGLLVAAHLAVRRLAPGADGMLLPLAGLLNGIGYVFIARLDRELAGLQATWTAIGIGAFILTLVLVRRARDLERYRYTALVAGVVLLMLPLVPGIGREVKGARIWVGLGPVNFQPGEFAKITLAIFFAAYLVERRELLGMATWPRFRPVLPEPRLLGPVVIAWGLAIVVMTAEKDLGSSLLFFALFMVLLWVATERAVYLVAGAGLFSAAAVLAWRMFAHVQDRVTNWIDPWKDANGKGYQIIQGWYAMAWGGVGGRGIGLGSPTRIPEAKNDFIFAAIGEELGLLGATAVLIAFLLMVGAGLRIAVRAESAFDKLLATGLTALLAFQTFIIVAGVIRLLPLTGVTLPFVSYGGSSLVANYVLLALLLRISDETSRRERDRERLRNEAAAALDQDLPLAGSPA